MSGEKRFVTRHGKPVNVDAYLFECSGRWILAERIESESYGYYQVPKDSRPLYPEGEDTHCSVAIVFRTVDMAKDTFTYSTKTEALMAAPKVFGWMELKDG